MDQLVRDQRQLGHLIQRHRHRLEMTQQELAARTGLRQSTISQIETGDTDPRITTLFAVLAALDLEFHIAFRTRASHEEIIGKDLLD